MPTHVAQPLSGEAFAPCALTELLLSETHLTLRDPAPYPASSDPARHEEVAEALLMAHEYLNKGYKAARSPALDEPLFPTTDLEKQGLVRRARFLIGTRRLAALGNSADHACSDPEWRVLSQVLRHVEDALLVLLMLHSEHRERQPSSSNSAPNQPY